MQGRKLAAAERVEFDTLRAPETETKVVRPFRRSIDDKGRAAALG